MTALLSNLHINDVVLRHTLEIGGTQLINHATASFVEALTFLKQVVLVDTSYCPPVSVFPSHLGTIERRLGNPYASVVGEFKMSNAILESIKLSWPDEAKALGNRIAVKVFLKRTRKPPIEGTSYSRRVINSSQCNEFAIYQRTPRDKNPSRQIVRLVYYSDDHSGLGIAPVGANIDLRGISSKGALHNINSDVLKDIIWLHSHGILHHDIRRENVIVDFSDNQELHATIIDFGVSIVREDGATTFPRQEYLGGHICCSREVIGHFSKLDYPCPTHDYLASVMFVNFLVFPNSLPELQSNRVEFQSVEAENQEAYWVGLEKSVLWRSVVTAAKGQRKKVLASMVAGLLVML